MVRMPGRVQLSYSMRLYSVGQSSTLPGTAYRSNPFGKKFHIDNDVFPAVSLPCALSSHGPSSYFVCCVIPPPTLVSRDVISAATRESVVG